jgi:hypothetical protein
MIEHQVYDRGSDVLARGGGAMVVDAGCWGDVLTNK